jgi:O-antigen ligase
MKALITRENIWLLLVGFTLCSFAGSERINSWGIIALSAFPLADLNLGAKLKLTNWSKSIVPSLVFFGVYLFFFLFSEQDGDASHALVSKLSFLLLPLAFTVENYFSEKNERILLLFFSLALSVSLTYQISNSLIEHYFLAETPSLSRSFSRMNVSSYIMHPGYFSAYLLFGVIWHILKKNKFSLIFISIFTIGILILLSRIVILFYILFLIYCGIQYIRKSEKKIRSFSLIILATLVASFAIYQIPPVKNRIISTVKNINNTDKKISVGAATASRRITYEQELYLIEKKPIFGFGLGNATEELRNHLETMGFVALSEKMNTHNQYVNTWMNTGIFGFVALLIFLGSSFIKFRRQKREVAVWIVLMISFLLLTDDLLEIQANSVFFALTLSLYLTSREPTYS